MGRLWNVAPFREVCYENIKLKGAAVISIILACLPIDLFDAQRDIKPEAKPDIVPYQEHFVRITGEHWPWRAAQVKAESGFRLGAVSPVGARGPAQFMPSTWRWAIELGWVKAGDSPHDLIPALTAQHKYMLWLYPRAGHDKGATTGAYNCGLGNVQRAKAHAKALGLQGKDAWLRALPSITKHHAKETQDYVARVRRFESEIRSKASEMLTCAATEQDSPKAETADVNAQDATQEPCGAEATSLRASVPFREAVP